MNIIRNCIRAGSVSLWNAFTFLFNRLVECCRAHKSDPRAKKAQLEQLMKDVMEMKEDLSSPLSLWLKKLQSQQ